MRFQLAATQIMVVSFLGLLLTNAISCNSEKAEHSRPNQLTQRVLNCWEPSQTRLQGLKAKLPSGFIKGFPNDNAIKRFAGLPDAYVDYLIDLYNKGRFKGISARRLSGGALGLAQIASGYNSQGSFSYPVLIHIVPGYANFALQHEVGHAVEYLIKAKAKNLQSQTSSFAAIESAVIANPKFRSYSRTSPAEAFADLFSSYYCSPKSHELVKASFSAPMYRLMTQAFEKPPWQQEADRSMYSSSNENADIKLFVVNRTNGKFEVYASASEEITKMAACSESAGTGQKSCLENIEVSRSKDKLNFFKFDREFSLDETISIKAMDSEDKVLGSRVMSIAEFTKSET